MMIEVFKTNVDHFLMAKKVVDFLHQKFENYEVNFDLEDCDHILRVKNSNGEICPLQIVDIMAGFGLTAEVLQENVAPVVTN